MNAWSILASRQRRLPFHYVMESQMNIRYVAAVLTGFTFEGKCPFDLFLMKSSSLAHLHNDWCIIKKQSITRRFLASFSTWAYGIVWRKHLACMWLMNALENYGDQAPCSCRSVVFNMLFTATHYSNPL